MNTRATSRLLSIGEFASATQLSAKALRLYDDQRLLVPARIDPATGYRYYRSDQVATGRLIRTMREMDLPLTDVAHVLAANEPQRELLLAQLGRDLDVRYARQKRAFQSALLLLRDAQRRDMPTVEERRRPAMMVMVHAFTTDRHHFLRRVRLQTEAASRLLAGIGATQAGACCCRLVEPPSDEESQVELIVPLAEPAPMSGELTVRHLPAASCAVIATAAPTLRESELSACLDTLFDWFDRHGRRALDVPWICYPQSDRALTELIWAYEPCARTPE